VLVLDIYPAKIDIYTATNSVQKATVHMSWSVYRSHVLQPSQTKTILLLDESHFLYHRLSITKNTKKPYSRSEHKQLINEKIDEIQHQYGVKKEAISFATKHIIIK